MVIRNIPGKGCIEWGTSYTIYHQTQSTIHNHNATLFFLINQKDEVHVVHVLFFMNSECK